MEAAAVEAVAAGSGAALRRRRQHTHSPLQPGPPARCLQPATRQALSALPSGAGRRPAEQHMRLMPRSDPPEFRGGWGLPCSTLRKAGGVRCKGGGAATPLQC